MTLNDIWFVLFIVIIAGYLILDGFDMGVGIVHLFVAKTDSERRVLLNSIGPVWDGNEVWLLAGGGVLYFAFPALYASSFSGFYLPLMIVLWLLIGRGVAIEFRNHLDSPVWRPFFDFVFTAASALLAIFFGAALGNVVRGAPLNASGDFFLPLWTDFRVAADAGVLDWYTVLVGLLAFLTLTQHGALWLSLKTDDILQRRAQKAALASWVGVVALTAVVTVATLEIQPQVRHNLLAHPWGAVFPALALAGLAGAAFYRREASGRKPFLSSCVYIIGMLTSAAFGVYPYVLPSNTDPKLGLTIWNSAAGSYSLAVGLAWWIPGMALVVGYTVFAYRHFAGKVRLEDEA
jgi:cytochrome d ubiquinol oxidase subunit II